LGGRKEEEEEEEEEIRPNLKKTEWSVFRRLFKCATASKQLTAAASAVEAINQSLFLCCWRRRRRRRRRRRLYLFLPLLHFTSRLILSVSLFFSLLPLWPRLFR
jgi:hypothetical protein